MHGIRKWRRPYPSPVSSRGRYLREVSWAFAKGIIWPIIFVKGCEVDVDGYAEAVQRKGVQYCRDDLIGARHCHNYVQRTIGPVGISGVMTAGNPGGGYVDVSDGEEFWITLPSNDKVSSGLLKDSRTGSSW